MDNKEILDEIEKVRKQLDNLENKIKKTNEEIRFEPQDKELYLFINAQNLILNKSNNADKDKKIIKNYNAFHLEADLSRLQKVNRLNNFLMQIATTIDEKRSGNFVNGEENYYLDVYNNNIIMNITSNKNGNNIYFSSKSVAVKAISELKKFPELWRYDND